MARFVQPAALPPKRSPKRRKPQRKRPENVQAAINKASALTMRRDGFSWAQIANKLKVSERTAYGYVQAALIELRENTEMDAQSVRDLDLSRCDAMLAGLQKGIRKGDPQSVSAGIRVLERRSKLLGLDAPSKAEWVGALTAITPEQAAKMSEADIQARVKELMDRVAMSSMKQVTDGQVVDADASLNHGEA